MQKHSDRETSVAGLIERKQVNYAELDYEAFVDSYQSNELDCVKVRYAN